MFLGVSLVDCFFFVCGCSGVGDGVRLIKNGK
jgi:hypothetical protein